MTQVGVKLVLERANWKRGSDFDNELVVVIVSYLCLVTLDLSFDLVILGTPVLQVFLNTSRQDSLQIHKHVICFCLMISCTCGYDT